MIPVRTDYSNVTYTAEGCFDLPATIARLPEGHEEVETVWELTDEELAEVQRTGKIYMYILGRSVPPISLTTESCI